MSSIVTIIAVSVGAGLISLAIFVACAGFLLLDAIGKGLGGRSAMGGWETPLLLLACLGVLISLAICPAVAYFLRNLVFEISNSSILRVMLLALIAGLQVILLATAYTSMRVYSAYVHWERSSRTRMHRDIGKQLAEADIRVSVERAKILEDDGEHVRANITLRIDNVPATFPYYELYISKIDNQSGIFYVEPYLYPERQPKPWIKAINIDGTWNFEVSEKSEPETQSPNTVTFDLNFERGSADSQQLPKSISPAFLIRWKEFNSTIGDPTLNIADLTFFNEPISINFE